MAEGDDKAGDAPEVAAEVQIEQPVVEPAKTDEPVVETTVAGAQPPDPTVNSHLQRRIGKLTARLRSAEAALVARQAGGAATAPDEAAIQRLIEERAEALAESKASAKVVQRDYDRRAQEAFDGGVTAYGKDEFTSRVEKLKSLRDDTDQQEVARYDTLIAAMLETGEAPKLVHLLGGDLEEAARLMELSPLKLGIELARLAAKDPPSPLSTAPRPIVPLNNRGRSHVALKSEAPEGDSLSTDEWMRRRVAHADQVNRESGRRML